MEEEEVKRGVVKLSMGGGGVVPLAAGASFAVVYS